MTIGWQRETTSLQILPQASTLQARMERKHNPGKRRLRRLPIEIRLRGRAFVRSELELIRNLTVRHLEAGRTAISERVCEELNWKQPNGWLKDRACRDVLRALHTAGFIRLPQPKIVRKVPLYSKWKPLPRSRQCGDGIITDLPGLLTLRLAKGNADEKVWNDLVQRHHYLGHKITVGRSMKFLICVEETIVGAISLADGAWNVEDRDKALRHFGWSRQVVANNSRFLLLPHIRVKYLASRSLALLAREGVRLWNEYYACELKCLETFVDTLRFAGTSYKAANWILAGKTKGYRKCGASFYNSQTPKFIFLYPLASHDRDELIRFQNDPPKDT
jgi:hypothetical protein